MTGRGLELGTELRYGLGRFGTALSGRWLAAHTAEGYRERGLSASIDWRARENGTGFALSLAPSWGAAAGGAGALWGDGRMQALAEGGGGAPGGSDTLTWEARLGYGLRSGGGTRVQPWASWRTPGGSSRELGWGLEVLGPWTLRMEMNHRATALEPGTRGVQSSLTRVLGGDRNAWR